MVGREHRDPMSEYCDGNKDLIELSRLLCDERKQLENGVVDQNRRRVVSSEGGMRVNHRNEKGIEMNGSVSATRLALPQQSHSSQAITVCWERFLHTRSLKVLLVENDDCTRHIIAALLQNCCYEVVEAANGLQAWQVLEDITNRIDIVLTEVAMPCLSGVALLCKIMSHKTRKNIPVIMMSSHDSMGVVFNCLSKGAVDFLVKPLRKNELRNLWQHVWRKCRSSSVSGSESATYTNKSVKFRSADKSDNESGSYDDESPSRNFGDGSDHGSGTQNSWTKQAVEDQTESPLPVSPMNEITECRNSTCAQVIHPNIDPFEENIASMSATKECEEHKEQPVKSEVHKTLIANLPKSPDSLRKSPIEVPVELSSMNPSSMPNLDSSQLSIPVINGMDLNSYNPTTELDTKGAGIIHEPADPHKETKESDTNEYSKIPTIDVNPVDHAQELPFPDQSLKRVRDRDTQESGKNVQDDRNVLRRSGSSAFSRYNAALHSKISSTDARSLSPLENGLDGKPEVIHKMQSFSASNIPNQWSNGGSVYRDMTSTSNNNYKKDHSEAVKHVHPPIAHSLNNELAPDQPMQDNHEYRAAMNLCLQPKSTHQELQMQPGRYLDHKHHAADTSQPQHQPPNHDNLLPTKAVGSSHHCQSSNMMGRNIESTAGNYTSLNGSGSGSNNGSNGPNGSSSAANVGGMNMEIYDGVGCESGSGSGSGSGNRSGNKLDPDKFAQREAALNKYRQKRKELCFERKSVSLQVRYQSRKKLAEQRPRVRGQFVKQTLPEMTSKDPTDSQT